MSPAIRRAVTWLTLAGGLLGIGRVVADSWPHENSIRIGLAKAREIRLVTLTIQDLDGESFRTVELRPNHPQPRWLTYNVSLPSQIYVVRVDFSERPLGHVDKNQGGGWTTVGTQHQIRLDGGDHYFPPPDSEAQ